MKRAMRALILALAALLTLSAAAVGHAGAGAKKLTLMISLGLA